MKSWNGLEAELYNPITRSFTRTKKWHQKATKTLSGKPRLIFGIGLLEREFQLIPLEGAAIGVRLSHASLGDTVQLFPANGSVTRGQPALWTGITSGN